MLGLALTAGATHGHRKQRPPPSAAHVLHWQQEQAYTAHTTDWLRNISIAQRVSTPTIAQRQAPLHDCSRGESAVSAPLRGFTARNRSLQTLRAAQAFHPQWMDEPVPCEIDWSHTHRFAFVRCPKCAGSAAYAFFGAALNGSWPSGSTDSWIAQTAAKRHGATPIKQLMRDVGFRGRFPWASWRAVPEAVWQDYFIFTLVRSPWTRAVSAFQYCADLGKGGPLVAEWKQQKLQTRDIFGRHCARPASTPCWREHVQPMGPCVIGPAGEPLVDYVGVTAGRDLGRVLSTIVSEINKRNQALPTPPPPLSLTAGLRKLTRPDEDAGKTRKALGNPGIPSRRVRDMRALAGSRTLALTRAGHSCALLASTLHRLGCDPLLTAGFQDAYFGGDANTCKYLREWPFSTDVCRFGFAFDDDA